MHAYRTHNCGALRAAQVGERVRLSGWVHRKRDHGDLLFVDLRDHYGLTQIVTDVDFEPLQRRSTRARRIGDHGHGRRRRARDAETVNPNLPTGEIEVRRARGRRCSRRRRSCRCRWRARRTIPRISACATAILDLRRERLHANIVLRIAASSRRSGGG